MKQINLNVMKREKTGCLTAKRYRAEGKVPAVIYGESGVKNIMVEDKTMRDVAKAIAGKAALLELFFDDGTEPMFAMVKEVSRNSVKDKLIHVDFIEVVRGKEMKTIVPLHFFGEAYGVKNENGVVDIHVHEVKIICRPKDLPESIDYDVSEVKVGTMVTLGDLKLPDGVSLNDHKDKLILSCALAKAEESAKAAEAGASGEGVASGATVATPAPAEQKK